MLKTFAATDMRDSAVISHEREIPFLGYGNDDIVVVTMLYIPQHKNLVPSVSKILKVGSQGPPGHDIGPFLHNPSNIWASNLCFSEIYEDINSWRMNFSLFSAVHPQNSRGVTVLANL